ncbi:cytochrome P450 4g1-like [Arctopsyche grandis]|uniref:cytochrome P450 4g1-like n=1 Tax=Arctopsyche grandis TaxID=121162 RepID=UPI00406D6A5D
MTILENKTSVDILLAIVFAYWIYWLWKRRKLYYASSKLSGPLALPLVGNAIQIGAFGNGHEIVERLHKMSKKYPSPYRIWGGLDLLIVISEPDDLEMIYMLKSNLCKDKRYDMMKSCIGSGILSSSGPIWKKHRQILNPAFNRRALNSYQYINDKHAKNLVNSLMKVCDDGKLINVVQYCKRCSGDVFAESLFEEEMMYYKGDKDHLLNLTTDITELIHDRLTKFWQEWDFAYSLSKNCKRINLYLKEYRNFYHTLVKEKIKKYVQTKEDKINNSSKTQEISSKNRSTFETLCDALIDGKINEQEILDEFDNIYNPAMDTTYSQIGFFMMVLGMHKDCQNKLWNEIKEFYKHDMEAKVQTEHLRHLPYLEMCIKELIRLFPTGPIVTRYVTKEFKLKTRDVIIPVGTYLVLSTFILHRDPKYWENPNSFMPERFSAKNTKTRPQSAYLPFSLGQHTCIGQHSAMDLLRTVGVYLIRNFEFHSDLTMEELKLKSDISIRSALGYKALLDALVDEFRTSILFRILILFLLTIFLGIMWSRRKLYALSLYLPGPMAFPILGNTLDLEIFTNQKEIMNTLVKMKKKYGEIFRVWLGPELSIVLSEPEDVETVLLSKIAASKGPKYDLLKTVAGEGLLTSSGDLWKRHRHILNPSFNKICIKSYFVIHNKHAKHMSDNMAKMCNKGLVDVAPHSLRCTADTITEAVFGDDNRFYEGTKDDVLYKTPSLIALLHERICKVWLLSDYIYNRTATGKFFAKERHAYRTYFDKRINDKMDEYLKNREQTNENSRYDYDNDDHNMNSKNSLEIMMEAVLAGKFSRQEVINEFDNIYNPGMDTTYTTLCFFIVMIAINKEHQDKIWNEIKEVFAGDIDAPVTPEHLPKLKHLEMCLKETTRLHPTGPTQMRYLETDLELKHRKLIIPKGASLVLATYSLHRNPKYYENPDKYEPERFLPQNSKRRPQYAFVPFSAGLRDCIGRVFGYDMLKVVAVYLLRNLEFTSDLKYSDIPLVADISVRSAIGYHVTIKKRNRND